MFEVFAQGQQPGQRVRVELETGRRYSIGRGESADVPIPWDAEISRLHAEVIADEAGVQVLRTPPSRNPLFFQGAAVTECLVAPQQNFVLGTTVFHVIDRATGNGSTAHDLIEEVTFSSRELRKLRYRDADHRIEVLSHLPEVIWGARSDRDLHGQLVELLLTGILHADGAAVVGVDPSGRSITLHGNRRRETDGPISPSSRLVREAIQRRTSVLHVWGQENDLQRTVGAGDELDWAFCTPIPGGAGPAWALYVSGKHGEAVKPEATLSDDSQLQSDVKFTELIAEIISAVRRLNTLERRQAGLRQFFAPPVLAALGDEMDTSLLEPSESDITVMFCDLRGFSHQAEESADDLLGLLDRVSRALGVMTAQIVKFGGVTGDFLGDAALGFWGWPIADDAGVVQACRAALGIRTEFARTVKQPHHPLTNFAMGIGMAHGRAVAGKIGTSDQVKVTVFGPVVNLASRLEGLTKQLRVPVLLDEATVELVRPLLAPEEGRIRRLAKVLPYGTETPVVVSELLPPYGEHSELTDEHLRTFEAGVNAFITGDWDEAYRCLHEVPPSDRAQDFLTLTITQHGRASPPNWDGVIRLTSK